MSSARERLQARLQARKVPFPKTPIYDYTYTIVLPACMIDVVPIEDNRRQAEELIATFNGLQEKSDEWTYVENGKNLAFTMVQPDICGGELVSAGLTIYDTTKLNPLEPPAEVFLTGKRWRDTYHLLSQTKYGAVLNIYPLERFAKLAGLDLSECSGVEKFMKVSKFIGGGDPSGIAEKLTPDQVRSFWYK